MQAQLFSWLQTLTEDRVQQLLSDLLREMGYERVTVTHGPLEQGRDIVFLEVDKLGREVWRAIQVKVTPLTGNLSAAKGLRAALEQCEAALDSEFVTSSGEKVMLAEAWLITTKQLSEAAKLSASGKLKTLPVYIIDGPHLSDLLAKHLPNLIASGSQPIDEYLKNLIDYCDSIEQYMAIRLNARFSLSDVFVPSRISITLAKSAAKIDPLSASLPFSLLKDELVELAFLSRASALPALTHLRVTSFLTNLRALLQVPTKMYWYSRRNEDTANLFESLATLLAIDPFSTRGTESLPTEYRYDCVVDVEVLHSIESELRRLPFEETKVLDEYAKLEAVARTPTSKDFVPHSAQYFDHRQKVRLARTEFFQKLESAYRSLVNDEDPMARVVTEAAYIIFTTSASGQSSTKRVLREKNEELEAGLVRSQREKKAQLTGSLENFSAEFSGAIIDVKSNLERLQSFLDDFHHQLRDKLEQLWLDLDASIHQMRITGAIGCEKIESLAELEQLTHFVKESYDLDDGDCEELIFDSVDTCLKVPKLVVTGDLGHGKTTLLKQVAKTLAGESAMVEPRRLPVFCSLATLGDSFGEDPEKQFLQSARSSSHSLESISRDEIVWILDGFDEVQSLVSRDRIVNWLSSNLAVASSIIISSRPYAISRYLPGILTVSVLPFSATEIEKFIKGFPWEKAADAQLLISVLDDAPELFELATTPLLLTLIVILAQTKGPERIPKRREGLYELILQLLLGDWDVSKGLRKPQTIEDEKMRLMVVKKAAYKLYSMRKRSFTKEEFVEAIIASQVKQPFEVDLAVRHFADLLRDCVIVPLTRSSFGFFHLSIQEYLAAAELADDIYPDRVFGAIQEFLGPSGWWEEVIVFYAGIKRNVGDILTGLSNKSGVANRGLNPNFQRLLRRMLSAADLTDHKTIVARGSIAAAFAELKVGGEDAHWRDMIGLIY